MHDPTSVIRDQLAALGTRRTGGERPAKVLVIGNFGNGNTGDEALLARALQEVPQATEVTVLSRNPRLVEWLHCVPSQPMTLPSLLTGIRWCDAVLVVGGGMFGAGLPPAVSVLPWVVDTARKLGRDTGFLAVGAYPGMPEPVLRKLRAIAAQPGRITVRDRLSAETLGGGVVDVGDLALGLRPASPQDAERALAGAGVSTSAPLLLLSLKALPDQERMTTLEDTCLTAARRWREHGGSVAALALSTHADYGLGLARRDAVLAGELADRLGAPIPVLGPQLPPALAKALVGKASGVLGLRLHAMVFAAGTGVPCAGFDWEEKSRAFLASTPRATVIDGPDAAGAWADSVRSTVTA